MENKSGLIQLMYAVNFSGKAQISWGIQALVR